MIRKARHSNDPRTQTEAQIALKLGILVPDLIKKLFSDNLAERQAKYEDIRTRAYAAAQAVAQASESETAKKATDEAVSSIHCCQLQVNAYAVAGGSQPIE